MAMPRSISLNFCVNAQLTVRLKPNDNCLQNYSGTGNFNYGNANIKNVRNKTGVLELANSDLIVNPVCTF
jgi:hypothetical protein